MGMISWFINQRSHHWGPPSCTNLQHVQPAFGRSATIVGIRSQHHDSSTKKGLKRRFENSRCMFAPLIKHPKKEKQTAKPAKPPDLLHYCQYRLNFGSTKQLKFYTRHY